MVRKRCRVLQIVSLPVMPHPGRLQSLCRGIMRLKRIQKLKFITSVRQILSLWLLLLLLKFLMRRGLIWGAYCCRSWTLLRGRCRKLLPQIGVPLKSFERCTGVYPSLRRRRRCCTMIMLSEILAAQYASFCYP